MLISVIVPCYNHGRFLPDLVRSMQEQTLQDFEIIIVDDASTDNTQDLCSDVVLLDKRVQVLRLDKNAGKPTAINVGMTIARGNYFTVVDADDMRAEKSLEFLYKACIENPHSFAYDDMILFVNGKRQNKVWKFPEYDFATLLHHNTIHTGIMFERKAFEDTGGYPTEFFFGREDWAFNLLLGTKGYCGVHVKYPGYIYRREGQNRTLYNTSIMYQDKFAKMIRARFPDLYDGRFPMGCCGQRSPVVSQNSTFSASSAVLVGSEGMTAVEYIGGNFGTVTFYGAVTGTAYRFDAGPNKKKMVDNRDLSTSTQRGLLDMREHTKALFAISQDQPSIPAPSLPVEDVVEDEEMVSGEIEQEPGIETIVEESTATYKKLKAAGIDTIAQVRGHTLDELIEKTGLSKASARAVMEALK